LEDQTHAGGDSHIKLALGRVEYIIWVNRLLAELLLWHLAARGDGHQVVRLVRVTHIYSLKEGINDGFLTVWNLRRSAEEDMRAF
jgi:hypothetical protein